MAILNIVWRLASLIAHRAAEAAAGNRHRIFTPDALSRIGYIQPSSFRVQVAFQTLNIFATLPSSFMVSA